jgi:hypothetical protein
MLFFRQLGLLAAQPPFGGFRLFLRPRANVKNAGSPLRKAAQTIRKIMMALLNFEWVKSVV